jgi:hypothetical protein
MVSLSGRYKADKPQLTPAPNAYTAVLSSITKQKSPSYGLGTGPKQVVDLSTRRIVPGPGQYQPVNKSAGGVVFGRSIRTGMTTKE